MPRLEANATLPCEPRADFESDGDAVGAADGCGLGEPDGAKLGIAEGDADAVFDSAIEAFKVSVFASRVESKVHELRDRFGLPGMRILQGGFGPGLCSVDFGQDRGSQSAAMLSVMVCESRRMGRAGRSEAWGERGRRQKVAEALTRAVRRHEEHDLQLARHLHVVLERQQRGVVPDRHGVAARTESLVRRDLHASSRQYLAR